VLDSVWSTLGFKPIKKKQIKTRNHRCYQLIASLQHEICRKFERNTLNIKINKIFSVEKLEKYNVGGKFAIHPFKIQ